MTVTSYHETSTVKLLRYDVSKVNAVNIIIRTKPGSRVYRTIPNTKYTTNRCAFDAGKISNSEAKC